MRASTAVLSSTGTCTCRDSTAVASFRRAFGRLELHVDDVKASELLIPVPIIIIASI